MNVEVIVKYNGSIEEIANLVGAEVEILSNDYAILTLDANDINKLLDYSQIEYLELARRLGLVQVGMRSSCISSVQPPSDYDLTGKGVLIAVLDSGIDYFHSDFMDAEGNSRILYIWDQNLEGIPPDGFNLGVEFNNEQINAAIDAGSVEAGLAIVPSEDSNGHGTAVAGVAAGSGRLSGDYVGAAPEASIIVVKLASNQSEEFTRTTDLMRALKYVSNKALELNMPLVINISFGTNDGSHTGLTLFEQFMNEISSLWKTAIVVASGNEGYARHHYKKVLTQNETVDIEFTVGQNLTTLSLAIWKDFADEYTYELISSDGSSTGLMRGIGQEENYVLGNTQVTFLQAQPTPYFSWQSVYLELNGINGREIPASLWRLRVRGMRVVKGLIDAWLPITEIVGLDTAFLDPSVETTLTIPSTAEKVITVSGYNPVDGSFADFSGRGSTKDNVFFKPDVAAPAVDITAPRSGGGYGSYTGTSFAAPHVAGGIALLMQWGIVLKNDINLYGQRVKAYLQSGATRSINNSYPDINWGYGKLCIKDSLDALIQYNYQTGGVNKSPLMTERFVPFVDTSTKVNGNGNNDL